ncbi:hypothetical protein K443DRAFT_134564 [Laccaria amethystina LaAM-08-1]|uniref:Uncharacterized protein n=1 Tax=Laccaria amethystina LaAM-08-1 TaxID=1095629 RepID=A0A0C9XFS2_9AGAR|nr:hypothetical protein K443DRAFT_134564 [Laccaria amethystina LaAM-08-1]
MEINIFILSIFGLFLIPLSIRYFLNPCPAQSIFLASAFLLLKPPIASSLIFESLPHALQIASIVAFFVAGDALFKALLYIGADPQSGGGIAPTALNALIILGRIFGGLFMDLARSVLGLQLDLLNFAGRFGRNLYGLEGELENDVELESQTHANRPPSYNDLSALHRISDEKIRARENS